MVNIQAPANAAMYVNIMYNNIALVETWADDQAGLYTQASNSVITECQRGMSCGSGARHTTRHSTHSIADLLSLHS